MRQFTIHELAAAIDYYRALEPSMPPEAFILGPGARSLATTYATMLVFERASIPESELTAHQLTVISQVPAEAMAKYTKPESVIS